MDVDALDDDFEDRLAGGDLLGAAHLLDRVDWDDLSEEEAFGLLPLWEELADAFAERSRFGDAIATIHRGIELGGDDAAEPALRAKIAGYRYRAGEADEARSVWQALADERPHDVWLHFTIGLSCADADAPSEALPWLTGALETVVSRGDREGLLADLLELREEILLAVGETEIDDLQERGEHLLERGLRQFSGSGPVVQRPEPEKIALAWFPRSEWAEALRRWPDVGDGPATTDYRDYVFALQSRLVDLRRGGAARLSLAPLFVDAYLVWAEAQNLDPAQPENRATYGAEVARLGNEVPWPPGRNDPCWCGSGARYKKCCAN